MLSDSSLSRAKASKMSHSVEEAFEIIEKRKENIRAKLLFRKEHLLTQEEEQDIHTRADLYAITALPENSCFVLPENAPSPVSESKFFEQEDEMCITPHRKKRRRNYGNTDCYVNYHNHEDIFDNTKMLPLGTKLLKPSTKLVEMVAQTITGSPDGLLQVQQIYTYLQNKYPFFRYMDRVAVNSWRSSIRHALYQKWFRKIRFGLSFSNSKGCYWAINNKNNPKEWSMSDNTFFQSVEYSFYKEILEKRNVQGTASLSREENDTDVDPLDSDLEADIPQCPNDTPWAPRLPKLQGSVPSPIREPDPLLATCAVDWNNNELCQSSSESGCGTMSPVLQSTEQLLSPYSDLDHTLDLPDVKDKKQHCRTTKSRKTVAGTCISMASPMLNWTPNWDEYGSYILSPQNIGTQKYLQGFPGGRIESQLGEEDEEEGDEDELISPDLRAACRLIMEQTFDLPVDICSTGSQEDSIEYEILAEYSQNSPSIHHFQL
ncbi:hypothetical protein DPMN_008951 [Dreissena polymorpha]|uniref:Fork-head domain-containing protein n=2 Tax=Dreissena polymorpha TaxID=45954 RepID=A0A9D4MZE3_DREPO|nr:hypothetical protein DPMN_008951 [Dreissena polymorpha]